MTKERFKITPASYLILTKDNQILMLRRYNTGYEDGNYSLIAGHLDGQETFKQAIIREAREEADVILNPNDLKIVHAMHRFVPSNEEIIRERIDVFVATDKWEGEPQNMEPHKCDDLNWFSIDNLPGNTIPYIKQAINSIKNNIFYSEFGF
ncbi:NUDIX domain-containing protein [Patescibacteria group bacterium]|nr:NUDIX domain-containing protein [Patescibacteria group bacterium]